MKIFVAGARSVKELNEDVKKKLLSISEKCFDVLVGDCYGVDTAVQNYLISLNYRNVTVFASNGIARNNKGNWKVENVVVEEKTKGFDFYRQKDIAMTNAADYGFMIWDGKSKGTLNNIVGLVAQGKKVVVYLVGADKMISLSSFDDMNSLVLHCTPATKALYHKLMMVPVPTSNYQLSLFD